MEIVKMKVQLFFLLISPHLHDTMAHVINLPVQQLGLRPFESSGTSALLGSQLSEEPQLDSSLSYRVHVVPLLIQRDETTGQNMVLSNGQSFIMTPNNFLVEVLPAFNNELPLISSPPLLPVDPNIQSTNPNIVNIAPVTNDRVFVSSTSNETPVVITQNGAELENTNEGNPLVLRSGLTTSFVSNNIPQLLSFRPNHRLPVFVSPKAVASHDTSNKGKVILAPSSHNILLKLADNKPTVRASEDGYVVPLVDEVFGAQNSGNFAYRTDQIHGYAEPIYYDNMARKVSNDKMYPEKEGSPKIKEPKVILKVAYDTTLVSERPTLANKEEENQDCTTNGKSFDDAVIITAANVTDNPKTEKVEDVNTEKKEAENETQ